MSLDATRWAWQQQGLKPSEKLVLLSIADRAGEAMTAHPSVSRMELDTGLNRKTIISCFDRLEQKGLIVDTGETTGRTKRVKIYQLVGVLDRHENSTKNGTVGKSRGSKNNNPKNGTIKQYQKGDSSDGKQSRFFPEIVPKTELPNSPKSGTQNLPGMESTKEPYKYLGEFDFSEWPEFPTEQVWIDYQNHRKTIKAKISQTVIDRLGKQLSILKENGVCVDEALGMQLEAGWRGLEADWVLKRMRSEPHAINQPNRRESLAERSWRESEEILADLERSEAGDGAVAPDAPAVWPQVGQSGGPGKA